MKNDFVKYFNDKYRKQLQLFIPAHLNNKILSKKRKLLSWISVCQAAVETDFLRGFIKWSLDSRVKPAEIYEVLLQGHLFCGYPAAIESFFVFNDVLRNSKIKLELKLINNQRWDYNVFKQKGLKTAQKIYDKNFESVCGNIRKLSPDLAAGMIIEGYGRIISRDGLDILTRELAIVAALVVMDMPRQLYSHIRGAFNSGAAPRQIKAIIEQCRFIAGEMKVKKALRVYKKSLGIKLNHQ